jgi:hypothetical protein
MFICFEFSSDHNYRHSFDVTAKNSNAKYVILETVEAK